MLPSIIQQPGSEDEEVVFVQPNVPTPPSIPEVEEFLPNLPTAPEVENLPDLPVEELVIVEEVLPEDI